MKKMKLLERHVVERHVNDEKGARNYSWEEGRGVVGGATPTSSGGLLNTLLVFLRSVFLPEGYPDSVSRDYIYYQGWDTLQAFASSISGSLATAAVLEGVGVGDSSATTLAASLTWLMRDGTGMLGRIMFAAYCGTGLDYDCKKWRLLADVLNDAAMLAEILTPRLAKPLTMPVLCLASLSRSIVGVAGGSTKAAVAQHQARNQNMADLCAKDGSQETMVNLLALLVNLLILPLVSENKDLVMPLFLLLTILHIYANYKAVRSLNFDTVNIARLDVIIRQYLASGEILSVEQGNRQEPLGFTWRSSKVRVGCSLRNVKEKADWDRLESALKSGQKMVLLPRKSVCLVLLAEDAGPQDLLQGWLEASLMMADSSSSSKCEEIIRKMEAKGWRSDRVAIQTEGFYFQQVER